jgi:flagellar protein FliJ
VSRRFPLAAVLRVRRIQQDRAGAEVARARMAVEQARGELRSRDLRVDDAARMPVEISAVLPGVMASRLSLAAEAAAARASVGAAETVLHERLGDWAAARAARRGIERLAERHQEELRAQDARRAQSVLDDLTGAAHHRSANEPGGIR